MAPVTFYPRENKGKIFLGRFVQKKMFFCSAVSSALREKFNGHISHVKKFGSVNFRFALARIRTPKENI